LIFGLGIISLGVPPSGEETGRALLFLVATIFYGGIWAALALLFSVTFRSPATAALASLAVWLFFTVFWDIIVGLLAPVLGPSQVTDLEDILSLGELQLALSRISPITLYAEVAVILLQPSVRSLGIVLPF
jgi:ABC-2 type transport system permease protein